MRRSLVSAALVLTACRPREAVVDGGVDASFAEAPASSRPRKLQFPTGHGSFVAVIEEAAPAVVAIRATQPVKSGPAAMFPGAPESTADVALGTGFLIEHRGRYVLTNDHIAAASPTIHVVLSDGSEVAAAVVGRDPKLDLALLAVDVPRLPYLELGDSKDLVVGEWVVALGNPFGDEVTASAGVISSTGTRGLGSPIAGPASLFRTFIQTDARIHRGNSGGPLLDTAGQVVGVAVATDDRPGEISFAIPIDRVKEVLDSLRDFGKVARAYLGAMVNQVPADVAQALPEVGGAIVTEVHAGSPAVRAGLRPGDVILKWDGKLVDHRTLPSLATAAVPDRKVSLTVWRNGAALQLDVVPAQAPD